LFETTAGWPPLVVVRRAQQLSAMLNSRSSSPQVVEMAHRTRAMAQAAATD